MEVDVLKEYRSENRIQRSAQRISMRYASATTKRKPWKRRSRCLHCKNPEVHQGCPVNINIPAFIAESKEGNFEKAYEIISESSALPAVCGRVCPQETQCEGQCIRGIKGDPVSIGKLERFVADWAREKGISPEPAKAEERPQGGRHRGRSFRPYLRRRPGQGGL